MPAFIEPLSKRPHVSFSSGFENEANIAETRDLLVRLGKARSHAETAKILILLAGNSLVEMRICESVTTRNPLNFAVMGRNPSLLQALLDAGTDPDFSIGDEARAISHAITFMDGNCTRILLDAGCDFLSPDDSGASIPLMIAHQKRERIKGQFERMLGMLDVPKINACLEWMEEMNGKDPKETAAIGFDRECESHLAFVCDMLKYRSSLSNATPRRTAHHL